MHLPCYAGDAMKIVRYRPQEMLKVGDYVQKSLIYFGRNMANKLMSVFSVIHH